MPMAAPMEEDAATTYAHMRPKCPRPYDCRIRNSDLTLKEVRGDFVKTVKRQKAFMPFASFLKL